MGSVQMLFSVYKELMKAWLVEGIRQCKPWIYEFKQYCMKLQENGRFLLFFSLFLFGVFLNQTSSYFVLATELIFIKELLAVSSMAGQEHLFITQLLLHGSCFVVAFFLIPGTFMAFSIQKTVCAHRETKKSDGWKTYLCLLVLLLMSYLLATMISHAILSADWLPILPVYQDGYRKFIGALLVDGIVSAEWCIIVLGFILYLLAATLVKRDEAIPYEKMGPIKLFANQYHLVGIFLFTLSSSTLYISANFTEKQNLEKDLAFVQSHQTVRSHANTITLRMLGKVKQRTYYTRWTWWGELKIGRDMYYALEPIKERHLPVDFILLPMSKMILTFIPCDAVSCQYDVPYRGAAYYKFGHLDKDVNYDYRDLLYQNTRVDDL